MKNKICIVVSTYKEDITPTERISLQRLNKVCGDKYDIYLIAPDDLNVAAYGELLTITDVNRFDKSYFKDTATYSQLLVQREFYETYKQYDYMLIYQPDCYIFRDELQQWADKGFDYIGAPIISAGSYWPMFQRNVRHAPVVGNGGFSLRKIQTFIDICDEEGEIRKTYDPDNTKWKDIWCEDRFFCDELQSVYSIDRPIWQDAARFSWDMNPDSLYDLYKLKDMPMGCHAVEKNMRFWKDHIEEYNDDIVAWCEEHYHDFYEKYYDEHNKSYRIQS